MSTDNINFKLQIGNVNHPQSYIRASVHNDQNERSRIASTCGCHPETGSIVIRVSNSANLEELTPVFMALTESSFADLQSQGKVQEFPDGSHKWIKLPLDIVAGGMISGQIVPMISSDSNLSGNLDFSIESDLSGHDLKAYRDREVTMIYGLLKSFKVALTTNLSKDQLVAISGLVKEITGAKVENFHSAFGKDR